MFAALVISQILFISSNEGICDVFENNLSRNRFERLH